MINYPACPKRAAIVALVSQKRREAPFPLINIAGPTPCFLWKDVMAHNLDAISIQPTASLDELRAIRERLCQVADADTAFDAQKWAKATCPLSQHCKAVSTVLRVILGGVILYCSTKQGTHYWNLLPCGSMIDFSASQFSANLKGDGLNPAMDPTHVLIPPKTENLQRKKRFKLLLDRYKALEA